MKKMRFIIVILICMALEVPCIQAATQWEQVRSELIVETDRIEVSVNDGYIYINTPREVTVKIFSIVGQLISQEKIPQGVSRIKIKSRGIYIVKAGETTLRVTI